MRDLFEDVAGKIAARPGGGGAAYHPRAEAETLLCQGRRRRRQGRVCHHARRQADPHPYRPPGRGAVREIADAVVAEWQAQPEFIDPLTMPLTRFANSVVDAVVDRVEAVTDDVAKYLQSDLRFYRAGHPEALVAREAALWDPLLFWAADTLGAHFILAEGIVHVSQPESAIAAARAALPGDPWSIAALHVITTLTGSALIALALLHGVIGQEQAWAAAHVDEDWNSDKWGVDDEVGGPPRCAAGRFPGRRPHSQVPESGPRLTPALRQVDSLGRA